MGYSPEHKVMTRERIIESAARLFCRYGYNGVGIDDIMAAAHLTRGGFYAHFTSKRELFAATLAAELEPGRQLRNGDVAQAEQGAGSARGLIAFYLDPGNRRQIAARCPLVSLSADVARAGHEVGSAYTETVRGMVADVARRIPGAPADARSRALAALALCVGGAVLAHALDDEALAEALLNACRARAVAEIDAAGGAQFAGLRQ